MQPALPSPVKLNGYLMQPAHGATVTEAVSRGMQLHPHNQSLAAKEASIAPTLFSTIRKLILIDQGWRISAEERELLKRCLATIDTNKQINKSVRHDVHLLIARYWPKRKDRVEVLKRNKRRFDATIISIRESCASTSDLIIPSDFKKEDVIKAIASLSASIAMISKLISHLVGEQQEVES